MKEFFIFIALFYCIFNFIFSNEKQQSAFLCRPDTRQEQSAFSYIKPLSQKFDLIRSVYAFTSKRLTISSALGAKALSKLVVEWT